MSTIVQFHYYSHSSSVQIEHHKIVAIVYKITDVLHMTVKKSPTTGEKCQYYSVDFFASRDSKQLLAADLVE